MKPRDVSVEFPTPEPPPRATPLPKLELKRDAELEAQIAKIAEEAKGKVGVAAVVIETGEAALVNADGHYPMQSVYKLPIAMAVMDQVRLGKLDLDEVIGVTPEDFVRKGMASALRDKNPNGGEFTIRELIRLVLVESDGTASDVLMRVMGGAEEIQSYVTQIGIVDLKVIDTEKVLGEYKHRQYHNFATPTAAVDLLNFLFKHAEADGAATDVKNSEFKSLLEDMNSAVTGPNRLRGNLPRATTVAHKTGTSGTLKKGERTTRDEGGIVADLIVTDDYTPATNDIGIVYLPNGKHLAIAVFVSDSPADEKTREGVIAKIAKAAFGRWSKTVESVQQIDFNTRHTLY